MKSTKVLYVVATPIGNLDDISLRARTVLQSVTLIAAEDTRRTGKLLEHLGISTPLLSLHEHNEGARTGAIIERIEVGETVALVSDAGTPLISDPGYRLVAEARKRGISVSAIPGCCAAIAALSVAGLPTDRFRFEGFLPSRASARRTRIEALKNCPETIIFYEAVHRIDEMLADLERVLGDGRAAFVARELTKLHETVYSGPLAEIRAALRADPGARKGEFTVVVAGATGNRAVGEEELDRILSILIAELPAARAAGLAARLTGVSRRAAYDLALRKTEQRGR